jgi:excisionase family DNA binding protein
MNAQGTLARFGWSLKDINERTGLSLGFLRNEVRAGRLPSRRFGRRVLIIDEDLRKYLGEGSPGHKTDEREGA